MNAVARVVVTDESLIKAFTFNFELSELKILVLGFLLLASALGVVNVKDLNRRLFITYHQLQKEGEQLQSQSNKLLLEQSAWSAQARVQIVAKQQLGMQIPLSTEVMMVKV